MSVTEQHDARSFHILTLEHPNTNEGIFMFCQNKKCNWNLCLGHSPTIDDVIRAEHKHDLQMWDTIEGQPRLTRY